jgi:hypothetical protein
MGNRTALFSRTQPGGVFTIADVQAHPGNVWFVDSGAAGAANSAGAGQNPDVPFATLAYAFSSDSVTNGDVVYVMPGHTEAIASATALVMDIAGVKVVGLGWGTKRPTFTITTAAASTWNVTAASCWIENVLIVSNFLNIAAAITVGADADGLTLKNVEMRDTSVILGALIQVSVAAGVTDITIDGFKHQAIAGGLTAPATNVILCAGAADRFALTNSRIYAFTSAAAVGLSAAASADITIDNVDLLQADTSAGLGIACHNSTTGFVDDVVTVNLKNTVKGVTGTGLSIGPRVYYSNAVNAYAGLFSYTIDS